MSTDEQHLATPERETVGDAAPALAPDGAPEGRVDAAADPADTVRPSDQPASDPDRPGQEPAAGSDAALLRGERDRATAFR